MIGKVMQGVRVTNIPAILAEKNCAECSKLLKPRIITASVIPKIEVIYVPNSKYQYILGFDFGGMYSIPVFTVSIQINPDYAEYFSNADLAQIQLKTIDPAVLSIANDENELSNLFDD